MINYHKQITTIKRFLQIKKAISESIVNGLYVNFISFIVDGLFPFL